jgi:hypothetical protein
MKKSKTIYLVTSGDYSDYSVDGAYSSREKAQVCIDYQRNRHNSYVDYRIEEYVLDMYLDQLARGLAYYYVYFKDIMQGDAKVQTDSPSEDDGVGASYSHFHGRPESFGTGLWAKDEQAALKIANERRTKFLARRGGIGA